MLNTVIYDIAKSENILFSKSYQQLFNKEMQKAKIKFDNKNILLNKKAT